MTFPDLQTDERTQAARDRLADWINLGGEKSKRVLARYNDLRATLCIADALEQAERESQQ